jgi:hypothetical protein
VRRYLLPRFRFPTVRSEVVRTQSRGADLVIILERELPMARIQAEVQALAERIQALADADRAKILAQVMLAEGKKVPWSALQRVQRRVREVGVDGDKLDRDIVEAVREVRLDRTPKSRG